jgi:hypothetical protein
MKKFKLLIALIIFAPFVIGQSVSHDGRSLIEAHLNTKLVKVANDIGDFTITDSDGVTHNLYESLDAGKTVFIDLFFST